MIIIEGPDNSGKTTLGAQLTKWFRGAYFKYEWKPSAFEDIWELDSLVHDIQSAMKPRELIVDRHSAISDAVYGPIIRGEMFVTPRAQEAIYPRLTVIYCRPQSSTIRRFKPDIDQMEGVVPNINQIIEAYDNLLLGHHQKFAEVIVYDYQMPGAFDTLTKGFVPYHE
jgi:hypothetical protein